DVEGRGKLTDHELRVIDLDGDQSEGELELQRGRALELEAGAAAAHFDAKRIAADRLGRAILRSAGLPLALAPQGYLRVRTRGGIKPQGGPGRCQHHYYCEGKKQRPTAAASGRGERGGRHHGAPVPAKARGALPGARSRKWRLRRFKVNAHRNDLVGDVRAAPRSLISQSHGPESRARDRRPLGVRLWLADVAAGLSVCRAGRGATRRRASGALRLFFRPPRDAGAARPRARPRPRRDLSWHRLSRDRDPPPQDHRLSARA